MTVCRRMLAGTRAARNELLKDVMRDYGYLEHMGLGVPRKIVRGMREFNGTEPEFVTGEEALTVILRRGQPSAAPFPQPDPLSTMQSRSTGP